MQFYEKMLTEKIFTGGSLTSQITNFSFSVNSIGILKLRSSGVRLSPGQLQAAYQSS